MLPIRSILLPFLLSSLAAPSLAQDDDVYTVWASVILNRIGERTPSILGTTPTTLTSLGAQQAYKAGAFFRDRYITPVRSAPNQDKAPLDDLNAFAPDVRELYALALDTQSSVASAQAWLQGLYPPYTLNQSVADQLEPTSVLSNGTYVENPLDGYQYVQLHTAGSADPEFPFIAGALNCPAFGYAQLNYMESAEFEATQNASKAIFEDIAGPIMSAAGLDADQVDYINAYAIYDFVNYQIWHNATLLALLGSEAGLIDNTNETFYPALRALADQQQYAFLGNLTAYNNLTSTSGLPDNTSGSISTIGGNLVLAKILSQLQTAAKYDTEYYKLSALFADYQSFVSMFALLGLPAINSHFYGLPEFASSAVFELFSYAPASNATFPDQSDLWVRFYFRNGTADDQKFQSYSIFNRGPSEQDMQWTDFEAAMNGVVMSGNGIGDWCTQCGATPFFCAAWANDESQSGSGGAFTTPSSSKKHHLSPTVAGVIGGIIALVIAGLIFGLLMLLGGMRFYRLKSHKKEMGGFKGSAKLASDRDLTIPSKSGAVVGATVERSASPVAGGGHERIGSWEMKKAEGERGVSPLRAGDGQGEGARKFRPSFEDDEEEGRRVDPFADPVKADERV